MSEEKKLSASEMLQQIIEQAKQEGTDLKDVLLGAADEAGINLQTEQAKVPGVRLESPNFKNYIRPTLPASVKPHLRKLPTMEVTFLDGSFDGKVVVITAADFDKELHEKVIKKAKPVATKVEPAKKDEDPEPEKAEDPKPAARSRTRAKQ